MSLVSGLAFKIMATRLSGSWYRPVYSGQLKTGDSVLNTTRGKLSALPSAENARQ